MRGITRFSIVMTTGILLCIAVVAFLVYARHQATLRDIQRLSDMRHAEYAFTKLAAATGSFVAASNGCLQSKTLLASCDFSLVGLDLASVRDPGRFAYRMEEVPSHAGYSVTFTLEQKHGAFIAGMHTLTPQGIR